jgi:hypothetical protein
LRYGLHACARPLARSGATFIRRCSHAKVTLNVYAIATQATNRLLRQDSHLQETEQLFSPLRDGMSPSGFSAALQ